MSGETFYTAGGRTCRVVDGTTRKGGQAVVYRAELDGQYVAVKVYHDEAGRADAERRLLQQIQQQDPSAREWLVTVLDAGTIGERPFLVLPWMDTTLADWVPGQSLGNRVAVLIEAVRAVERLHAGRVGGYRVHRDIKPDNLLLNWEGRWVVRLADLGAAKGGETRDETTNTGVRTEKFAPPEQALPIQQEPAESWDVHALAVTVFWVLTERIPIPALDAGSLLNADGRELVRLTQRGLHGTMNADEQARYQVLRRRRPTELLDLESAEGWRVDDTAHLRRALDDAGVDDESATRLLRALVPALGGALEPDPRRRDGDVGSLAAALTEWARVLPAELDERGSPTAARAAFVPSAPTRPRPRAPVSAHAPEARRRRWIAGVAIVELVAIASLLWRDAGREPDGARGPAPVPEVEASDAGPSSPVAERDPPEPQAAKAPPAAASATLPPAAAPGGANSVEHRRPMATARETSPAVRGPGVRAVESPAAPPVTGEATPVAAAVPTRQDPVVVRVRACPQEGATVSVDGGAPVRVGALAARLDLSPGDHVFVWNLEGQEHTREVTIDGPRGLCHAFTVDRACGRCED